MDTARQLFHVLLSHSPLGNLSSSSHSPRKSLVIHWLGKTAFPTLSLPTHPGSLSSVRDWARLLLSSYMFPYTLETSPHPGCGMTALPSQYLPTHPGSLSSSRDRVRPPFPRFISSCEDPIYHPVNQCCLETESCRRILGRIISAAVLMTWTVSVGEMNVNQYWSILATVNDFFYIGSIGENTLGHCCYINYFCFSSGNSDAVRPVGVIVLLFVLFYSSNLFNKKSDNPTIFYFTRLLL